MSISPFRLSDVESRYVKPDRVSIEERLSQSIRTNVRKIIVLDDDPTGVQTVHDVTVITDWTPESIEKGFNTPESMFFILTNSRSFTAEETIRVHREIAEAIMAVSRKLGRDFLLVSRGDSTLRGHYPLETEVLRASLEGAGYGGFDGEIVCPFFKEGGRLTLDDIHYVTDKGELIPCGHTEFARDRTFGYTSSHLGEWIEEKTAGRFSKGAVTSISLTELRSMDIPGIMAKLDGVTGFGKVIVNAIDYCDMEVFCIALYESMAKGKRLLFRTAAGLVKVLGGISDQPLLTSAQLFPHGREGGGLIVAGSHTSKTTEQLEELYRCSAVSVEKVEFNSHLVVEGEEALHEEMERALSVCEELLRKGNTVCLSTRRERLELKGWNQEDELKMSVAISDALTRIVDRIKVRPSYVIAKGGITSSDIGTKALKVRQAVVAGQIKPGVPVWLCGEESKFPQLPYIIFPGNVGEAATLKEIVEELTL